jgi:hypothetical protein
MFFKSCKDGVHKFEPRYDRELPEHLEIKNGYPEAIEAFKNSIYVYDICVRCGKIIKRKGDEI